MAILFAKWDRQLTLLLAHFYQQDFVDLLRSIDVSKHDAKDLARTYEGNREGRVEYYKFLDDLAEKTKSPAAAARAAGVWTGIQKKRCEL